MSQLEKMSEQEIVAHLLGADTPTPDTPTPDTPTPDTPTPDTPTPDTPTPDTPTPDDEMVAVMLEQEKHGAETPKLSDEDLQALTSALGWDEGDLLIKDGKLLARTKIDGEVAAVSFPEMRKGYQKDIHLTRKEQAWVAQKERQEQALRQKEQEIMQQAQTVMQLAEQEFVDLQKNQGSVDLAALRESDPAEYAARVAEFDQRKQALQQRWQVANQAVQQQTEKQQQRMAAWYQSVAAQEQQKLREAMDWHTDEDFSRGSSAIQNYLTTQAGYNPQELQGFVDSRAAILADKARKYDELKAKMGNAKKKLDTTSNHVRAPGGRSRATQPPNVSELRRRAKASGSVTSTESLAYILQPLTQKKR